MPFDAFTIDTSVVAQGGYDFQAGLLAQLVQFNGGPIRFVVSEIVVRETLRHLQADGKKARDAVISALDRAVRAGVTTADVREATLGALEDPRAVARARVAAFLEATGAETVPARLCTVDALTKAYFDPAAPFEATGDKKREFPDAIALLSLEEWARSSGRTVLAVSADKGWAAFAERSAHIVVESDLAAALQAVQDHTDAVAKAVDGLLGRMERGEAAELRSSVEDRLSGALVEWEFEVEGYSQFRFEVESTELRLDGFRLLERPDGGYRAAVVRLAPEETVVRVDAEVSATASVGFSLYAWDSVDREELGMGSTSAEVEETFDAALLVTILGPIEGPDEGLDIDVVEVVAGLGSVDVGEIEIDYRGDDFDDYEQLRLELAEGDGDPAMEVATAEGTDEVG